MPPSAGLLLALFTAAAAAAPLAFWVSPNGNDNSAGTSAAAPLATLRAAQLALRAAMAAGGALTADAVVTVLPGAYFEREALVFTAADSGSGGFQARWECAGAVLYVGVPIPAGAWAPWAGNPSIFVANISSLAPPAPLPPPPPPGCGLVEPGISYDGHDLTTVLVPTNNVSACCEACAAQPGCTAWSLCVDIVCGDDAHPINCYLKSSAAGRRYFGPLRTSGTLPPVPPPAPAPWRFFALSEGARGATIARVPNRGSGYLDSIGVGNSDSALSWPAGSPAFPNATFDVSNSHVFCNLGADWFTETRPVSSLDLPSRTIRFEPRANGVAGCNGKAYLQGPKEFIDEPGEWALEPAAGLLYYWPYDAGSVGAGAAAPIVAATGATAIEFKGAVGGPLAQDITIAGLELRGSGFTPDGAYRIFGPGRQNDFPAPTDSGMVRAEDAARISLLGLRLLNAGLSAVWLSRATANVTVAGCWIEAPGFCGVTASGVYPGDPPFASAAAADVNHGHVIDSNLIYNVGVRVGHGAGVWLFQSGANLVTRNYIKEAPRNGVGMYGIRFGAGGGGGAGVLPAAAYGRTLDFFSALELLTTRGNEVSFNQVENVVRDSCDAGAIETWGIGAHNVVHTNSLSDCDSGCVDGSWMNFLYQDDASHWMVRAAAAATRRPNPLLIFSFTPPSPPPTPEPLVQHRL